MLTLTSQGLYCAAGDFFLDPKGAVKNAVVTHAHSDHARRGAEHYFTPSSGVSLLRCRLGQNIRVTGVPFGETFSFGDVKVSFHPAGHILGSAQVRMEWGGEVWVASGDYKRDRDPTVEPFEVVRCDVFITEATFGTPAYRWPKEASLDEEILRWWRQNREAGNNSVVTAYSLGKTQRILGELFGKEVRPIYCAPEATPLVDCYRAAGVKLAPTICLSELGLSDRLEGELVIAPHSFLRSPLAVVLNDRYRTAFASGWMANGSRGHVKIGTYDHGFVMSDHADWDDLVRTVRETGARLVYVQHRGQGALVRHLRSLGLEAYPEEELGREHKRSDQLKLFKQ